LELKGISKKISKNRTSFLRFNILELRSIQKNNLKPHPKTENPFKVQDFGT